MNNNDFRFADRISSLSPSPIRKIMEKAIEVKEHGKYVYELNIGQPDVPFISDFGDAITEKVKEGHASYTPYIGVKYLRETYARYLNHYFDVRGVRHLVLDTENIHVTNSGAHAICCTFLTICNPGDEVLAVEPYFSPYKSFLAVSGGVLKAIPTRAENGYALPQADDIEKLITPKTRAIIVNSPNNPSGKIYSYEEMERLARICVKHDLYFISDEVYREMYLTEEPPTSVFQIDLKDEALNQKLMNRIICIDSCSKSFSLCGIRIGFAISKKPIVDKIALATVQTVTSVSDLLQYGAAAAYDAVLTKSDFLINLRNTYRERLEASMEAIHEFLPHVIAPKPTGTFYIMIKFPELEDVTDFCYYMLEKFNLGGETVAVTPAKDFYLSEDAGKNEIRIALVLPPEKMRRSIYIISEALKNYKMYKESDNKKLRRLL